MINIAFLACIIMISIVIFLLFAMAYSGAGRIIGCISSVLIAGACLMFCGVTSNSTDRYVESVKQEQIVALSDSSEVSGRFFVGSGYINEQLYYSYIKNCGGYYTSEKISADSVHIYYSKTDTKIEWLTEYSRWWIFYCEKGSETRLYIPEGSIINSYNIDMQ